MGEVGFKGGDGGGGREVKGFRKGLGGERREGCAGGNGRRWGRKGRKGSGVDGRRKGEGGGRERWRE